MGKTIWYYLQLILSKVVFIGWVYYMHPVSSTNAWVVKGDCSLQCCCYIFIFDSSGKRKPYKWWVFHIYVNLQEGTWTCIYIYIYYVNIRIRMTSNNNTSPLLPSQSVVQIIPKWLVAWGSTLCIPVILLTISVKQWIVANLSRHATLSSY